MRPDRKEARSTKIKDKRRQKDWERRNERDKNG